MLGELMVVDVTGPKRASFQTLYFYNTAKPNRHETTWFPLKLCGWATNATPHNHRTAPFDPRVPGSRRGWPTDRPTESLAVRAQATHCCESGDQKWKILGLIQLQHFDWWKCWRHSEV